MMRTAAAAFGLAVGLATFTAGPASAVHITLEPGESGVASIGEPLVIVATVDQEDITNGTFTHTYSFGFNIPGGTGEGGASATPNFLEVSSRIIAGFDDFEGYVTLPNGDIVNLERDEAAQIPRINRIAAEFAAVDTGGATPYLLTITGSLLNGVQVGNYTGNIGVVPLPGAALLFLTALGGLVFARRYRRRGEGEEITAAAA